MPVQVKGPHNSTSVANLAEPFYDKIRANAEALQLMQPATD